MHGLVRYSTICHKTDDFFSRKREKSIRNLTCVNMGGINHSSRKKIVQLLKDCTNIFIV
jgi:hypothetical protein